MPSQPPYQITFGVNIPLRDGVALNATIFSPRDRPAAAPVVLTITPYGADRYYKIAKYFASHGYSAAIVDVRGRGASGGEFTPYVHEGNDAYDVITWLAHQPFSDGRVVMRGGSYTGFVQWAAAAQRPPALKAIVPAAASYYGLDTPDRHGVGVPSKLQWYAMVAGRERNTNFAGDNDYWDGQYANLASGTTNYSDFDHAVGIGTAYWDTIVRNPAMSPYFRALAPTRAQLNAVDIPILVITGAYDDAQGGTLAHWDALLSANSRASAESRILIGPWNHDGVSTPVEAVGGLVVGHSAVIDMLALQLGWFDHVLKGAPIPAILKDVATYYVTGANDWQSSASIDAQSVERLFLNQTGTDLKAAGLVAAPGGRSERTFVYDPLREPVTWNVFNDADPKSLVKDDLSPRGSEYGLLFESAPSLKSRDIVGRVVLHITARLNVPDTDFAAALLDVAPDSSVVVLAGDVLRARYRKGLDKPELVNPGQIEHYDMVLGWVGRRIQAGHRLRLLITSPGITQTFQRNRNTGGPVALEQRQDTRTALISIMLGKGGSFIDIPISAPE